jgi:BirA family biotin operon repressor/biotin-[acetyl-CoA-carboxylase] ligase
LSQKLKVTRTAIWARIEDLRGLGYDIEASPHLGYRLLGTPDVLHADDLLSRLGRTRVIGRDIRVFQETTSTNDVVEKLARDGVKEGVVVFAESQTRGRGRLGRKWTSPRGRGLWFSVLLRPDLRPQEATRLTIASATALRRAIETQTGLKARIKWPNDILVNGRKTAGILTELSAEPDHIKYVILGIGVDVNLSPADLPAELRKVATSLKAELGGPVARPELAVAILRELDRDYGRVGPNEFGALADEWEEHGTTIGHEVVISMGGRQVRGRAESLGEDGELLVRTEHGRLERIVGGDVTLEK